MPNEQLAERPTTVKDYLALPDYKLRFQEVLGQRAPQFMSALVSLAGQSHLANCDPKSIIASAMVAATLDLPIEKSLGFAHVVPYGGVAQFQMAAKGYIQLALRSAQYQRMNAKPINAEAFGGYDEVGEPKILWEKLDETMPIVGYAVAWKLLNGFTKVAYWPKAKVEDHARRFSKAYKAQRQDSPWFSNFDKMAIKTVVMNELRSWGVLSVQMQTALKHDMGAQKDIDSEVDYIDIDAPQAGSESEAAKRPPPPPKAPRGARAVAAAEPAKPASIDVTATPVAEKPAAASAPTEAELAAKKAAELKKAEPAPAAEPATKPAEAPAGRAFLKPEERANFKVVVDKVVPKWHTVSGVQTPIVDAMVRGEFTGRCYHINGAKKDEFGPDGAPPVAGPLWVANNEVELTLYGKVIQGKVYPYVEAIKKVEAGAETPPDEF
jgi:recombination protein RecT